MVAQSDKTTSEQKPMQRCEKDKCSKHWNMGVKELDSCEHGLLGNRLKHGIIVLFYIKRLIIVHKGGDDYKTMETHCCYNRFITLVTDAILYS